MHSVRLSVYEIADAFCQKKRQLLRIWMNGRALRQLTFSHWHMKAIGMIIATVTGLQFRLKTEELLTLCKTVSCFEAIYISYLIAMLSQSTLM